MSSVKSEFEPFSIGAGFVIVLLLTLLDEVGLIVSLVASYIFMKKGHRGVAAAMSIVNMLTPDLVPVVDEAFQFAMVVVPLIKGEGKDVQEGRANPQKKKKKIPVLKFILIGLLTVILVLIVLSLIKDVFIK